MNTQHPNDTPSFQRPEPGLPSWWKTQAAPLDGWRFFVTYGLFAVPPVVTLIFGGAAAWAYVLWVPMIVLATFWAKQRARREGAPPRSVGRDARAGLVVGIPVGVATFAISATMNDQISDHGTTWLGYVGLISLAVALASEPFFRRRYRSSFSDVGRGIPTGEAPRA